MYFDLRAQLSISSKQTEKIKIMVKMSGVAFNYHIEINIYRYLKFYHKNSILLHDTQIGEWVKHVIISPTNVSNCFQICFCIPIVLNLQNCIFFARNFSNWENVESTAAKFQQRRELKTSRRKQQNQVFRVL